MAPNILKELKGVNFSCASPASTSIDQQQYSLRMSLGSSGRAIDRFSPHLRDPLRAKSLNPELTTHHFPRHANNKPKLGSSSSSSSPKTTYKKAKEKAPAQQQQQQQLVSPASSSRFLLSGSASDDLLHSEAATSAEAWRLICQPAKALETVVKAVEPSRFRSIKVEQSTTTTGHDHESSSSSSFGGGSSARPQNHQVVVLRVSLHCKGCEGKVRKHLSKMEGVTSFTTDLWNKKVTVVGDVTPLGVLNSISKVKNAQLWRSLPPAST
ncbi:heavy metal-associated isoprenylated plant protein 6-like [Iris pallida]|uniref:Heavy metal-associated isoprenylated plant protein 6-like n=1 Tax=Iris pallida TaxID=29817 RepID=A0AAX6FUM1_IRIPA|nr:heavy metal-associated isoprenylated plant protein 6-like [Iris pallida]